MLFVRGHYLFREANSFPRTKVEETCELPGRDNVQGKYPSIFSKSNGGYYPSNIFRNTRNLPACHTPITSKVVNWLQFTSRLSNRLRFSWKNMLWRKSSWKRLPAGVNRMFHMADVRCAGHLWRSRILGSHLKFLHELIFLDFIRALSLPLTWRIVKLSTRYISKLEVRFLLFPGRAAIRREFQRLEVSMLVCVL